MISEVLREVNDSLREIGADFTVGATVDVPLKIDVEGKTVETHMTVEVTEDGYELINTDQQVDRIVEEMKEVAELDSNQPE